MKTCSQCNGELALIIEKTESIEGSHNPITFREYKCLDPKCQLRMDKETSARIKAREDKDKDKEKNKKK